LKKQRQDYLNSYKFLQLTAQRISNNAQIWIVGCSFAHGSGVRSDERFGKLISVELNLPVSFLTQAGTSIEWAADQILRSDIRPGDIVVWGLTGASRFTYLDELNELNHVRIENFDQIKNLHTVIDKNLLVSNHMIYKAITCIEQVKNYLEKLNCKFVVAVLPLNTSAHDLQILEYTSTLKHAILLFNTNDYSFIDYGTDNLHPGPNHNKWYAEQILTHLGKL
jgi:hypothetical protein